MSQSNLDDLGPVTEHQCVFGHRWRAPLRAYNCPKCNPLENDAARSMKLAAAEIEKLRAALRECVEQNIACFYHHYGENPEGGALPEYITRARALIQYETPENPETETPGPHSAGR